MDRGARRIHERKSVVNKKIWVYHSHFWAEQKGEKLSSALRCGLIGIKLI